MLVPFLATVPGRDPVAAWREAGSPKHVLMVWEGSRSLDALQRMGRRAAVWLEATPANEEDALDLAVAGATHIVARWPRDEAWIAATGVGLTDLLVVAHALEDQDAVRIAAPEALYAVVQADGRLEGEEPVAATDAAPAPPPSGAPGVF